MTSSHIGSEDPPNYETSTILEKENEIIRQAFFILGNRLKWTTDLVVTCPEDTKKYLTLALVKKEHEVFSVLFLDNKHRLIKYEEMFRGTIDGASVYPREVIKRALELNAAAIIIAHNHPSKDSTESESDIKITNRIKSACDLVDIRLLDHIIVGGTTINSLAEKGLM